MQKRSNVTKLQMVNYFISVRSVPMDFMLFLCSRFVWVFYGLALIVWINNSYGKVLPSKKIMLMSHFGVWLDNTFMWVRQVHSKPFGSGVNCIWNILQHRWFTSFMSLGTAVPWHNPNYGLFPGDATAMYGWESRRAQLAVISGDIECGSMSWDWNREKMR